MLRTITQPRALSFDIPASQEAVYFLYNPAINFLHLFWAYTFEENEKQVMCASENYATKHIDWLNYILLKLWLDQSFQAVMSNTFFA